MKILIGGFFLVWLTYVAAILVTLGLVVYAAIHFIQKFW